MQLGIVFRWIAVGFLVLGLLGIPSVSNTATASGFAVEPSFQDPGANPIVVTCLGSPIALIEFSGNGTRFFDGIKMQQRIEQIMSQPSGSIATVEISGVTNLTVRCGPPQGYRAL